MDTPRLVGGRYRLGDQLGSGGMGTVWQATDERLHRQVAIKLVQAPPGLSDDDRHTLARRTLREARAAAAISSPSVVTIFDVVDDGDMPWIVMELLNAGTLSSVIAEKGPLAIPDAVRVGLALLDALAAVHAAGVLHRGVKPSNVMVADRGAVVLTDFGVAILDSDASLTSSGALIGSPAYLAPERARGEPATPASDLWSLGATLYTAVEGHPPFQREGPLATLAAVMTDPPAATRSAGALAPLLGALLVKDPAARPRLDEVRSRLVAVLNGSAADTVARTRGPAPAAAVDTDTLDAADRKGLVQLAPRAATGRRPRARAILFLVAALVCAAGLVAGLLALRPGDAADARAAEATDGASVAATLVAGAVSAGGAAAQPGSVQSGAQSATTGSATTQPGTSGSETTERGTGSGVTQPGVTQSPAPATDSATGAAGQPAAAAVPAGYRAYTDAASWSLAVPEGWQEVRDGPLVDFRSPEDGMFLRVDSTATPAGDPVADWEDQERSVSKRLAGYERISIEAVEYRGWDTADWRFAWDGSRNRIRVLNRGFVVAADEAPALYYSAPEGGYDESVHQVAEATSVPRPR